MGQHASRRENELAEAEIAHPVAGWATGWADGEKCVGIAVANAILAFRERLDGRPGMALRHAS